MGGWSNWSWTRARTRSWTRESNLIGEIHSNWSWTRESNWSWTRKSNLTINLDGKSKWVTTIHGPGNPTWWSIWVGKSTVTDHEQGNPTWSSIWGTEFLLDLIWYIHVPYFCNKYSTHLSGEIHSDWSWIRKSSLIIKFGKVFKICSEWRLTSTYVGNPFEWGKHPQTKPTWQSLGSRV